MNLQTPIENITSIGRKVAPALRRLGLVTAQDLIFYWPFRYEDWSKIKTISEVIPGDTITIKGQVEMIQNKCSRWQKRMVTEGIIADNTGKIRVVWFYQPFLVKNLKPNDELYLSGRVETGPSGFQFVHPVYEKITKSKEAPTHTARIVPIYSTTGRVTQKQLRYLIAQSLPLIHKIHEWIPGDLIKKYQLSSLKEALRCIHFPENKQRLSLAKNRLKFNELFLVHLRAQVAKQQIQHAKTHTILFKEKETRIFVKNLPFQLTNAQRKTAWEILQDLKKCSPMNRLLEGDVGSGKTVVASIALLNTVLNQYQAAYLAPTEILALQQYKTFCGLFSNFSFSIGLLTGSQAQLNNTPLSLGVKQGQGVTKKKLLALIKQGEIDIIVGTHALIQDTVGFSLLGLVIVDEQHRFGVNQRQTLVRGSTPSLSSLHQPPSSTYQEGEKMPHLLSMTATPIPRSLALTLYGDLDLSIIDELPKGRKPITTKLIPHEKRGECYSFIKHEIKKGRQVFVICPLIDPSDKLGNKAATEEFDKLNTYVFPDTRIGLVHGKLKAKDKERVMKQFADHELDILVATPVIEVGIDIPNATVMMIESAERFGLAQLHQFRGRVGRSNHQSYCLLFTESETRSTLNRLQALVESSDGFALAKRDLEFRGPGEVYGIKQHGFDDILKLATLTDYLIIKQAQEAVSLLLHTSSDLSKFPLVKQQLDQFAKNIHLE